MIVEEKPPEEAGDDHLGPSRGSLSERHIYITRLYLGSYIGKSWQILAMMIDLESCVLSLFGGHKSDTVTLLALF